MQRWRCRSFGRDRPISETSDIFAKRRLTIGQLRAVADRRFGDAEALVATGDNARANGAQYLAGIVIEILLKGQLVDRYGHIGVLKSDEVLPADRPIWNLIWRSHDLAEMLERLPQLKGSVAARSRKSGRPYMEWLTAICSTWTIFARYSPVTSNISEAREFVERVRSLKEILR